MRRLLLTLLLLLNAVVAASEPTHFALVIHGRPRLDSQPADTPGYGLIKVAAYDGEPVVVTVTAFNPPPGDTDAWVQRIEWKVTTESGEPVAANILRDTEAAVQAPYAHRLRSNTAFVNFRIEPLPPGRYIVTLSWSDPAGGEKQTARREGFVVYRGDETPLIRAWSLRDRARAVISKGTRESYEAARDMLLEAARDNDDPSFYEELADISLPWSQPEATAAYYDKSLAVAAANLEKKFGPQREWPERAWQLYRPRSRKVEAFRRLAPEYAMKFHDVKVVIARQQAADVFIMERRSDGKQLRVVDPQE